MERLQGLSKQIAPPKKSQTFTKDIFQSAGSLKGKVIVITGASRGIGLAIAKRAARDGAKIAILAKTTEPHPKLPGTIYTAAKEIEELGGSALPVVCDIRFEDQIKKAIEEVVKKFGGIDILVNNASAINLESTLDQDMKRFDLMHQINVRGTFCVSKTCIPHLMKAQNPHILNLSPPLNMNKRWFQIATAYTISKYGMSLAAYGMSEEYKDYNIGVNTLWPRTAIATAAVKNIAGGPKAYAKSRTDEIMADAAYLIITSKSTVMTSNFFLDEDVLRIAGGVTDFKKYRQDPNIDEKDLALDFYVDE